MQVLKFGGSSVATADTIKQVASIVEREIKKEPSIIVVSALGKITDQLILCTTLAASGNEKYKEVVKQIFDRHIDVSKSLLSNKDLNLFTERMKAKFDEIESILKGVFILHEVSPRIHDRIISNGEYLSSNIISLYLNSLRLKNHLLDARDVIITDSNFTKAAVDFKATNTKIQKYLKNVPEDLVIVPGFVATDTDGNTTTLGRGGSDYTAAIIGAAVKASNVQIWTDVSGMMTADPRLVSNARVTRHISYQEAMELSHFGAKVIYPPTIQPLMDTKIPVWIKNTFKADDEGTLIEADVKNDGETIRGISSISNLALLSLEGSGMVGIPGISKRFFEALANKGVNVILITQASSEHSICVGVEEGSTKKAKEAVDDSFSYEIERGLINPLVVEKDLAIIALVGDNMKSHTGISGKMFGALGRNGVNIRAIAQGSSERNISAVIINADVKKAINVLHEEFFETTYKQVNIFVAGTGNVGQKLLNQLHKQKSYLLKQLRLQVRVIGIANSRKMFFKDNGIDLSNLQEQLNNGEDMSLDRYIKEIQSKNLRNSVFVDVTASEQVANTYADLFSKSISIVACNKIACSSAFNNYLHLKELATDHNASFLFETNVGAGLPVIGTLNDLLRSGDRITEIQAVLSGTLNYVFNNYDGTKSFAAIVKQAQDEGYTEPDPRLDLSGTDVMRKIMILAREAGEVIEMTDIYNNSFMPPSCMVGTVDEFYKEMEKHEKHFQQLYKEAADAGNKLKFVAKYKDGKASVGLQQIDPQHDFYHLYG
ncbi:MAG TPA: bifunctional aspartate kinase/homoserine dehydrogenase I, partial [Flavisolibacter sp.]|nr:bifunctional aspartate kinase/homoserine dehydrogenase I [Flavisolibacter sp.]